MPVVALDDTDARETGMCTTYVGAVLGDRLRRVGYAVERFLLVRCNPAVEFKTRGNAAVALHVERADATDEPGPRADGFTQFDRTGGGSAGPRSTGRSSTFQADREQGATADIEEADFEELLEELVDIGRETIASLAATDEPRTNPGLVVAPEAPPATSAVAQFATRAIRDHLTIDDAVELADERGYRTAHWGNGRGRIGALAAIGAWHAHDDWTYERIAYRESSRWGTDRTVEESSVFEAAREHYPAVWDTVDRTAGDVVCVPHTPGPVLFGIRGDDPASVEAVASAIDAEPVDGSVTFVTNQGTDAHVTRHTSDADRAKSPGDEIQASPQQELLDRRTYQIDGLVGSDPESRTGGHVFFDLVRFHEAAGTLSDERAAVEPSVDRELIPDGDDTALECVAFEPTKRFRDRVRTLRRGDAITVVGELDGGTVKLEKFALRDPVRTELGTPTCEECDRRMKSAGANQGYRCRP